MNITVIVTPAEHDAIARLLLPSRAIVIQTDIATYRVYPDQRVSAMTFADIDGAALGDVYSFGRDVVALSAWIRIDAELRRRRVQ
jgi:hypothetical protein